MKLLPFFEYGSGPAAQSGGIEYSMLQLSPELKHLERHASRLSDDVRGASVTPPLGPQGEVVCDWLAGEPVVLLLLAVPDSSVSRSILRARGVRLRDLFSRPTEGFAQVLDQWDDIGTAVRSAAVTPDGRLAVDLPAPPSRAADEVPRSLRRWLEGNSRVCRERAERLAAIASRCLQAGEKTVFVQSGEDRLLIALGVMSLFETARPGTRLSMATTAIGGALGKRPGPRLAFRDNGEAKNEDAAAGHEASDFARALVADVRRGRWDLALAHMRQSEGRAPAPGVSYPATPGAEIKWSTALGLALLAMVVTFFSMLGVLTFADYVLSSM